MISLQELQGIQTLIYNPLSPKEQRRQAENKLDQFQRLDGSWQIHIQYLQTPQVDDPLLFLLCIGLDRIIWRVWPTLSKSDQDGITNIIIQILVSRFTTLPSFVRSKIEQILATICKNSVSFNILFQLIQYCEQASLSPLIGISAFRTVLDEVLGNDMRVATDRKTVLAKIASDISPQLLNMGCNLCVSNIQSGSGDCESLLTSLALIKVIITKIPVGQHINTDTLYLLYSIAELSATSPSYKSTSLCAVENLTELMSKRYIPSHSSIASTPVAHTPSTAGRNAAVAVLIEMVAKAVNLIKLYCSGRVIDIDASPIVINLLQFVTTFSECHLERCLAGAASSPELLTQITLFLREMAALSLASTDPMYLLKISELWETLLMLDAVREHLTVNEGSTVCVPVLAHLVTQSSIMLNQNVADDLDALIEDLNADPFSDTQIRELVSNINTEENSMTLKSSSSSSALSASSAPSSKSPKTPPSTVTGPASVVQQQVQGSEENASDCSSLRQHTATCLAAFCLNIDARQWLAQSLPQLMQSCMTVLSDPTKDSDTKSAAALDACFYIRLMPVCVPPMDIFAQLCTLHSQLVESRIHSQGKPFVGMELCCVQVASQIVKTLGNNLKSSSASVGMESNIDVVVGNFAHIVSSVRSACDTQISPSPFPVMIGSCTLLLQSLSAIPLRTEASRLFKSELVSIFTASLLPSLNLLPIEVHALLVCSADLVIPEISNGIATELYTLSMAICNSPTAIDMLMEVVHINTLNRLCACLDALAKYHSTSTPEERQRFIQSVLPLQECLGPLITACLSALSHTLSVINTGSLAPASIVSKYHSLISICSLILSLVCGLQRSLGKKNFGATSLQTFDACVGLLSSGLAAPVMSSISGIHFIKQMIRLSDSIAQTSSATVSTAQYQVGLTEKLLTFICTYLTDTQICAELLQETIKAGTVAIGCYWNNKNKSDDTAPQSPPACLPIALLLTQLFVGSMDASIPPQDAATAIEGINQLLEMHNLFSVHWFQVGGCWMSILSACIRTLLLTAHPQQFDALVLMLIALQKSDLSKNSDGNLSSGFWLILGTETFRLATDLNINETAMVYLNDMFAKYPNGGGLEMHLYLDLVIHPLVADLAKAKT